MILSTNKGDQINFSVSQRPSKAFLVPDSCRATERNGTSIISDVKQMTPLKTIRTTMIDLAFLRTEEVGDSIAEDLIPDMLSDKTVETITSYVLSTYTEDSDLFPPSLWTDTSYC